jgi:predicted MFS family arabinose efflux permease
MEADLGLSKPELYGAATFGLGVGSLAAYPVGAAIDRGHGRAVLAGGSVFYAILAGIGVAQAMTLYEPAFAVAARRSMEEARTVITALTLWGGFASTVFVPLTQALLDALAWRGALVALALLNLAIGVPLHLAVVEAGTGAARTPLPAADDDSGRRRAAVRAALREPAFSALAVAFTLYYAAFTALTYHLYPLLLERGFDETSVVAAIAIIGPAQVAGRLGIWWLAHERPVRRIGMATVVALPASVAALIVLPSSFASLAIFAAGYGAANGVMTIVRGLALPEMVTKEAYGELNGILNVPAALARALAPVAAAALWSTTRSYDGVLVAVLATAAVAAAGFWAAALRVEISRP